MKKLMVMMAIAASAVTMAIPDAEAKRMGSRSSIGKQSNNLTQNAPMAAPQQAAPMASRSAQPGSPAAAAAKPSSPWKGILGGALLGLGLGALLSHLGIGGALAGMISTILMIALLAGAGYFIYRMVMRNRAQPMARTASAVAGTGGYAASPPATPEIGSRLGSAAPVALATSSALATGESANGNWTIPADMDVQAFVRQAKTMFIRMQAAWDRADVSDLREFTTPELFSETKQQLLERGASANHTDVVSLDARLLGVETTASHYMASVEYTGWIREEEGAPAEAFTEVWNLVKPVSGNGGWLLAGIQQR